MAIQHGTRSCYVRGCRQPRCVKANAIYERERRWEKYQPKPRPVLREISSVDLAWLAGLLEGEGAFMVQRVPASARQGARIRIRISLQMTDRDVVERVCDITGLGVVRSVKAQKAHHKDTFQWQVSAMKPVTDLMEQLRPLMGERRQGQIRACLAAIVEAGGIPQRRRRHGQTKYKVDGCRCDMCFDAKSRSNAGRVRHADVV